MVLRSGGAAGVVCVGAVHLLFRAATAAFLIRKHGLVKRGDKSDGWLNMIPRRSVIMATAFGFLFEMGVVHVQPGGRLISAAATLLSGALSLGYVTRTVVQRDRRLLELIRSK